MSRSSGTCRHNKPPLSDRASATTYLLSNVNAGTSAIYLSEDLEAVCSVGRFGRMGWFLVQTNGPRNVDIDPGRLAQIHAAFAEVGIPPSSMIDAIKAIVMTDEWSHPYRTPNDDEILENIAVN